MFQRDSVQSFIGNLWHVPFLKNPLQVVDAEIASKDIYVTDFLYENLSIQTTETSAYFLLRRKTILKFKKTRNNFL